VEAAATATATVAVEEKKERKWQDTLQVAAVSVTEAYKLLFNYTSCRETAMPRRCKHPLLKHLRNPTRHSNRSSYAAATAAAAAAAKSEEEELTQSKVAAAAIKLTSS